MIIQRTDYVKHFIAGFMIAYPVISYGWWWSLALVALAGGCKELYDMISKNGTAEVGDFFCTLGGFACVAFIEWLKSLIYEFV